MARRLHKRPRWLGPSGEQGDQFRKTIEFAGEYGSRLVPLEAGKGTRRRNWWKNAYKANEVRRAVFRAVNVGIANGYGDIVDVDFDDDDAASRRLAKLMFDERTASFGRGARTTHRLYRVRGSKKGQKLQSKNYGVIIEYRGERSQTMAPGSLHPDTDELIEWYDESGPLATDADTLLAKVHQYAAGCIILRHWKEGVRHDLASALTGFLVRHAHWTDDKIDVYIRTLRHAVRDDQKHENAAYERERIQADKPAYGRSNLKEILGSDFRDVEKWLCAAPTTDEPAAESIASLVVSASEYVQRETPEEVVAIHGLFSRRKIALFFGKSGAGKSFILSFIADALGRGGAIADWKVEEPLRVLYVEAEMDETEFHGRAKSILTGNNNVLILRPQDWESTLGRPGPYIDVDEDQQVLERLIEIHRIDVLIIEPLSWVLRDADENSNEDTKLYAPWFRKLKNAGVTILTAHNQGWAAEGRIRGASRIVDSMDLTFSVSEVKDARGRFTIKREKARTRYPMTPGIVNISVEVGSDNRLKLVRRYDGKNRRVQLLEAWTSDPTLSYRELAARFGVDERTITRDSTCLEESEHIRKAGHSRIVTEKGRKAVESGSLGKADT